MVDTITPGASIWQLVQGLGFCIGIFLVGIWAYKKVVFKGSISQGQERKIKILERCPLSPRSSLVLAKVDSKQFLIATNGDGIALVPISNTEIDKEILEAIEKEYDKAV